LRLLQALVQIAAGTTSSAADVKTWSTARGHFALGTLFFIVLPSAFVSFRQWWFRDYGITLHEAVKKIFRRTLAEDRYTTLLHPRV